MSPTFCINVVYGTCHLSRRRRSDCEKPRWLRRAKRGKVNVSKSENLKKVQQETDRPNVKQQEAQKAGC